MHLADFLLTVMFASLRNFSAARLRVAIRISTVNRSHLSRHPFPNGSLALGTTSSHRSTVQSSAPARRTVVLFTIPQFAYPVLGLVWSVLVGEYMHGGQAIHFSLDKVTSWHPRRSMIWGTPYVVPNRFLEIHKLECAGMGLD